MPEAIYKGKILDFFTLLSTCKVEVPIIQRDYAQGRIDKKEVRRNFLNALYESLANSIQIQLDFIYGSKVSDAFQPLDGQQRLTTLFLLHWYSATRDSELSSDIRSKLGKFSYETRFSSRDFCQALIHNPITILPNSGQLSNQIIDSNWFFLSWKKDPTIDSMLRTIDDIHEIFFGVSNLWKKLISEETLISFYYVELENIGLTDDLYIKMNARGKLLTPFENFKASFQKYIDENQWEISKSFPDTFACKIDTTYTDFFWTNFKKNNTVDESFMRLISSVAMLRQALERSSLRPEERANILTALQEQPNSVKPEHFTKAGFEYLIDCFEIYERVYKNNINLQLPFPLWRHAPPKKSFLSSIVFDDNVSSNVQVNSASYSQKILFFAQTEYLKRVERFNDEQFQDWMRLVRNIIARGDIDKDGNRPDIVRSPQTFDGATNLINELADGCESIYTFLASATSIKSQFAKEQVEEERLKSKLVLYHPELKPLIFATEDNDLFRGRINFVLYCINYGNSPESIDINLLQQVQQVFAKYFHEESEISNDLRRAMLTIEVDGLFEFYNYWWSLWTVTSATKRRLFDKFRELEYYIYSDQREYFKKLVLLLIHKDFQSIVDEFTPPLNMPNWKKRLIKENGLLDKEGGSHYIAIPEDNSCCYLLKSKRPRDIEGSVSIS
jgi:hypothetical protein